MSAFRSLGRRTRRYSDVRGEGGAVIVVAMVFVMIFIILGVALYWLVASQTRGTELERTDVKSFNVAEAGVDAGMLGLKLNWPKFSTDVASVDNPLLKTSIQQSNTGLWDPKRSDPSQFIQVTIYDNVNASGQTTTVPNPSAPRWDSNDDGKMFVDSTANVGDTRNRILILAERQKWELTFPANLALFASEVDSNAQGLAIEIENGTPPVYYDVHDATHKGVNPGPGVMNVSSPTTFDSVVNEALRSALEGIAIARGTYFTSDTAASAFLASGQANGKVVYIKSNTAVTIEGNNQIGTVASPVVVVIDTPSGSVNVWDMKGTGDLYGILVNIGDSELRGTAGIHGALYVSGKLTNKGTGSSGEINYNVDCITNINGQYTISVNIVPNTWEEYTTAAN